MELAHDESQLSESQLSGFIRALRLSIMPVAVVVATLSPFSIRSVHTCTPVAQTAKAQHSTNMRHTMQPSSSADGNGSFRVNGLTIAQSEARAYAEAFATGTVDASVCNRCSAAAQFVARSWSDIFFDAVVEAETALEGAANGGSVTAASNTFVKAVAEATVIAYAAVCPPATCHLLCMYLQLICSALPPC